jgi:hypothetical protein
MLGFQTLVIGWFLHHCKAVWFPVTQAASVSHLFEVVSEKCHFPLLARHDLNEGCFGK